MNEKPDIVERLRGEHWWLNVDGKEAADEIEWLRSIARDWMAQRQALLKQQFVRKKPKD